MCFGAVLGSSARTHKHAYTASTHILNMRTHMCTHIIKHSCFISDTLLVLLVVACHHIGLIFFRCNDLETQEASLSDYYDVFDWWNEVKTTQKHTDVRGVNNIM